MLYNQVEETATETFHMMQEAYGEKSMTHASILCWHKTFTEGMEFVVDDHQTG